jgi:DNA gyrase/topoisomerase IV subunit A
VTHQTESLSSITARNLLSYGQEVVMQRAVPDFRDGLKPVHRCVLWALYGLGLKDSGPFKKAARTVGEVLGKFHPHGDSSTYDAMVGIAGTKNEKGDWATRNTPIPLVEGFGNWGDNIDPPAAYRYTEARLSTFATKYMLDPTYLAVTDYVPNFSGDDRMPLVLPVKLPVLLLNGSVSIAFGMSAECPSFGIKGVLDLVVMCLEGIKITPKLCLDNLDFNFAYGGECISDRKTKLAFFKTGKGSISFRPILEVDEAKRIIALTSAAPGLISKASWATLSKNLLAKPMIQSVSDVSDKKGFRFEITYMRNLKLEDVLPVVEKEITRTQSYDIGVTDRQLKGVSFRRSDVATLIHEWCSWRIEMERKVVHYLISLEEKKLRRLNVTLLAVLNLAVIIASLKVEDSTAYLVTKLKITPEEANEILDLKVRQLKSLEASKLKSAIKEAELSIKKLQQELKILPVRVVRDLKTLDIKAF